MTKKKDIAHLRPKTRRWVRDVMEKYVLEQHHMRLLVLAAEAWDRCLQAREIIETEGPVYRNRFKEPRPHPMIAVERDNRIAFARLLRELQLDVAEPEDSRPPALYK